MTHRYPRTHEECQAAIKARTGKRPPVTHGLLVSNPNFPLWGETEEAVSALGWSHHEADRFLSRGE